MIQLASCGLVEGLSWEKVPFLLLAKKVGNMQFPSRITRWQPHSAQGPRWPTGKNSAWNPPPWEVTEMHREFQLETSLSKGHSLLVSVTGWIWNHEIHFCQLLQTNEKFFTTDAYSYVLHILLLVFFFIDLLELLLFQLFSLRPLSFKYIVSWAIQKFNIHVKSNLSDFMVYVFIYHIYYMHYKTEPLWGQWFLSVSFPSVAIRARRVTDI